MKSIDRAVERFCYKHPNFGIRRLMLYIIIGNAAVYLLNMIDANNTLLNFICFVPQKILRGEVWRLVTFLFMPIGSTLFSEALSLYFFYFIGMTLESHWGTGRFTIYYFTGVILSIIYGFVAGAFGEDVWNIMDTYYINMAMFFAFAAMWPDMQVYLFFFIPVKMKWLAIADAVLFAAMIILRASLYPLVAIVNFLLFCGYMLVDYLRRSGVTNTRRNEFHAAVHRAEAERKVKNYRHRCDVCGKTDTEFPNMEFRYCSRCAGYHCFCEEHINNHVHFTE